MHEWRSRREEIISFWLNLFIWSSSSFDDIVRCHSICSHRFSNLSLSVCVCELDRIGCADADGNSAYQTELLLEDIPSCHWCSLIVRVQISSWYNRSGRWIWCRRAWCLLLDISRVFSPERLFKCSRPSVDRIKSDGIGREWHRLENRNRSDLNKAKRNDRWQFQ